MVKESPLQMEQLLTLIKNPKAGAINFFVGTVREWTDEKQTLFLEYEAYTDMAEKMLRQIGEEIKVKWPGATVGIHHRIGRLEISDIAVIVAVSTPHRDAAFEASKYGIERIKELVPIWKKEHWSDGESWIGNQLETKEGIPKKGDSYD